MASERSERDTLRGNTIENRGYLFVYIYVCGRTYVILYFDPHVILCSLCVRPHPKLHSTESSGLAIITRITLEIELFTAMNSFVGEVKTQKTYGSSISIRVGGGGKLIRYLSQL